MLDFGVNNFELIMGSSAAAPIQACFGENEEISGGLNLSDGLDFRREFEVNMDMIQRTDINSKFLEVDNKFEQVNYLISRITKSHTFHNLLYQFNSSTNLLNGEQYSSSIKSSCPFNIEMLFSDIYDFDQPWKVSRLGGKTGETSWRSLDDYEIISYNHQSTETAEEYISRLFNVAGRCTGGLDIDLPQLCEQGWTSNVMPITPPEFCTGGGGCVYPCSDIFNSISRNFTNILNTVHLQESMRGDLGVESCPSNFTCPSSNMRDFGKTQTLKEMLNDLKSNLTYSRDALIEARYKEGGVAGMINGSRSIECNSNCNFIVKKYSETKEAWCDDVFGSVVQISGGLWALSVFVWIQACFGYLLTVRLRGKSRKDLVEEVEEEFEEGEGGGGGMDEDFDLYS